jgi:hypothetical protein
MYPSGGENLSRGVGVYYAVYKSFSDTVIVFRDTQTDGDYANLMEMHSEWFLQRQQSQILRNWQAATRLDVRVDAASDSANDRLVKSQIRSRLAEDSLHAEALARVKLAHWKATQNYDWLLLGLGWQNRFDLMQNGYWPLTKEVLNHCLDMESNVLGESPSSDWANIREGRRGLYFSGFSQGGSRAAMASMYLKKQFNVTAPAISFGGPGMQCALRQLSPMYSTFDPTAVRIFPSFCFLPGQCTANGSLTANNLAKVRC